MTDLERFVDLYRLLGIELIVHTSDDGGSFFLLGDYDYYGTVTTSDKLVFSDNGGGVSKLSFDVDGKFYEQTFWGA